MFHTRVRFDDDARRFYLQSFTGIEISSVFAWDPWVKDKSWKVRAGLETEDGFDRAPWASQYFGLTAGRGYAYETEVLGRELFYVFLEPEAGVGGLFRDWYRLGVGGSGGVHLEFTPWWRASFEAGYVPFFLGDDRDIYRIGFAQQFDLRTNVGLRVTLQRRRHRREVLAAFTWHI